MMLANRADIYNLGDTLSGREHEFSLSFIENSLTSNSYIAPLATRDMADLYNLVKIADGEQVATTELKHNYSQAEVNDPAPRPLKRNPPLPLLLLLSPPFCGVSFSVAS